MQTEPQVALALVEADELRDIGRRDADAPQLIQPDGVLILSVTSASSAITVCAMRQSFEFAYTFMRGWSVGGRIPSPLTALTPLPRHPEGVRPVGGRRGERSLVPTLALNPPATTLSGYPEPVSEVGAASGAAVNRS